MDHVVSSSLTPTGNRSPVTNAVPPHPLLAPAAVVTAFASATAAVIVVAIGTVVAIGPAIAIAVLTWAAEIDRRERRLPDILLALAVSPLVVVVFVGSLDGHVHLGAGAAAGAAAAAVPTLVVHLADPAAMGFGDVKASTVLGAAVGVIDWRLALVALCVAAGSAWVSCVVRRQRSLAFGPYLVAGAVVALLLDAGLPAGVWSWR